MEWIRSLRKKRIFFRYWSPRKVIEEIYKAIPEEKWSILESVEGCSTLKWLRSNVGCRHKLCQQTWERALEVVEFTIEMAHEEREIEPLTELSIKRYCTFIQKCLFDEKN